MAEASRWSAGRRILAATAVAGTLDILAAMVLTLVHGGTIDRMLRSVASGPIPAAAGWGTGGAALGLVVHFALMAIMATAFVLAADRMPALKTRWVLWGVVYGVVTWAVMNLLVVPLRFGVLPGGLAQVATQLFCHVVLVGIPIASIARR